MDNPISDGMRLAELQAGDAEEQALARVLDRLEGLTRTTEQIDERLRRSEALTARRQIMVSSSQQEPRDEFGRRLVSWDEHQERLIKEGKLDPGPAEDIKAEIEAELKREEVLGPEDPDFPI